MSTAENLDYRLTLGQKQTEATVEVRNREIIQSQNPPILLWSPQPGAQSDAYNSDADELFYGGAAGGGKTDLGLGLAFTQHRHAICFRRVYPNMRQMLERAREIAESQKYNGKSVNENSTDRYSQPLPSLDPHPSVPLPKARETRVCEERECRGFVQRIHASSSPARRAYHRVRRHPARTRQVQFPRSPARFVFLGRDYRVHREPVPVRLRVEPHDSLPVSVAALLRRATRPAPTKGNG